MPGSILDFLHSRHSTPAMQLGEPGPDPAQLARLLEAAVRVPDHGKLAPWRLLLLRGDAKARCGDRLAELHADIDPLTPPKKLEKDRGRFRAAPLVIAVIARIEENHPKIPAQEQLLSAGCVAYNLLLGAQSLGFGAQWLTGWSCYEPQAAALLGLASGERLIAYIHIGTSREPVPDRDRPAWRDVVSEWKG
ncbi:MAG: nitroreductase [Proteobacteria bacterium]|nr:nitroreductase [Pseudomonadota bacterium]